MFSVLESLTFFNRISVKTIQMFPIKVCVCLKVLAITHHIYSNLVKLYFLLAVKFVESLRKPFKLTAVKNDINLLNLFLVCQIDNYHNYLIKTNHLTITYLIYII